MLVGGQMFIASKPQYVIKLPSGGVNIKTIKVIYKYDVLQDNYLEFQRAINIIKYNEYELERLKEEYKKAANIIKYDECQIEHLNKEYEHAVQIIRYNEYIIKEQQREISQLRSSVWERVRRKVKLLLSRV